MSALSGKYASEVSRASLLQRIAFNRPKLILLEAPAGFGKSWLARKIVAAESVSCIIDALGVSDTVDYHRRLLSSILKIAPQAAPTWEREAATVARDVGAWRSLCVRAWHEVLCETSVIFENVESVLESPDVLATLQALFDRPHNLRQVIVCCRKRVPLRFGRFVFPHEIMRIGQRDLRFDSAALCELFQVTASADLSSIESITTGWPIAALLLQKLWRDGYRTSSEPFADDRALFSFLTDEVLSMLSPTSWTALLIIAVLDDAKAIDVKAALGNPAENAIVDLLAEAPFVDGFGDHLVAHPLLRDVVRLRYSNEAYAVATRAATHFACNGNAIRAAQIYMALGEPQSAVAVIAATNEIIGGAWIETASFELDSVLLQLDRTLLLAHPAVWAFTMHASGCALVSPRVWLSEGLEIWARHASTMSATVAIAVASNIINAYMNLGMLDHADAWLTKIQTIDSSSIVTNVWSAALTAMRGQPLDPCYIEREVLMRLEDAYPKAIFLYDVVARNHRMRGERDAERSVSARALALTLERNKLHGIELTATDAAFGAWLAGEDALFEHYLLTAERHAEPASRETTRLFLECARGFGLNARTGYEKLKLRSYAWLVAAARATGSERAELLHRALQAADASSQPYARILARVALAASSQPNSEKFVADAAVLAAQVDSPSLREAVALVGNGGAGGMLSSFVDRYRRAIRTLQVGVVDGTLLIDGANVPMPERQMELMMLLAVNSRPIHREAVVAMIWPDADSDTALGALRTLISRLRATAPSRDIVVTSPEGYKLAPEATTDLIVIRQSLARAEATGSVAEEDEPFLRTTLDNLLSRDRSRGSRWEWFASTEYELATLASRIASVLGRTALAARRWQQALNVGRRLLASDLADEIGVDLVVRALLGKGDYVNARREVRAFESCVRSETGLPDATFLRALFE